MKIRYITLLTIFSLSLLTPAGVSAARPNNPSPKTTELVGYDISYPQCGVKLPTDYYFGIVGINGGKPTTENQCLSEQLSWAARAKSGSKQPTLQLYVNTANPGELIDQITTWPNSNTDDVLNPYGICTGANDLACSWQYGWERAKDDVEKIFTPAASIAGISTNPGDYSWWLDVETMNSWQGSTPDAYARNVATLEAMTSHFTSYGAQVGLYSTAVQWRDITGNQISPESNLNALPNWRPSGTSLKVATSNCSVAPLTTGGYIALTQYVQKGFDKNHSCL